MYKLLLCVRYLRTRYIALACIISVMLGVATMIVVNSVMAGFTTEMRDRLHNFLADIVIESRSMSGIPDAQQQMDRVREVAGEYIAAMTPTIEIPGMITFTDPYSGESYTSPVQIQGIDPKGKALVGPLQDYLDSYNPVIEDGQVIRKALRSRDEPLSWELTEAARDHRRFTRERDFQFNAAGTANSVTPERPVEAPEFDAVSATSDSSTQLDSTTTNSDVPANSPPGGSITGIPVDDFLTDPVAADSAPFSPAEPRAKIYLGEGIVSFQAENPETRRLQKIMMVEPGDDVLLSTVTAGRPPEVTKFHATVVDSFRSGMNEYDTSIVLMNIEELQKNRGMQTDNAITSIHIRLKDYKDAPEAIKALERAFAPGQVSIKTWEQKQGLLLSAVEMETSILNVLLFLIITVAGFGILAIFYMIVVEKTRDIGILKSLGASSSGVMSIFLSYGLGLGIVGSTAGVVIGLLFVSNINQIEDWLSWLTGRKVFDEKIYYFFEIPTCVNPWMVFSVAFGAISIAVLASILPARRAARLHPVRALRFE